MSSRSVAKAFDKSSVSGLEPRSESKPLLKVPLLAVTVRGLYPIEVILTEGVAIVRSRVPTPELSFEFFAGLPRLANRWKKFLRFFIWLCEEAPGSLFRSVVLPEPFGEIFLPFVFPISFYSRMIRPSSLCWISILTCISTNDSRSFRSTFNSASISVILLSLVSISCSSSPTYSCKI